MSNFNRIVLFALISIGPSALIGCGDYGVAAGPSQGAKARIEYKKPGATAADHITDSINCGMDFVFGTLEFQFDKAEEIDRCMRSKGYVPSPPSAGNERPIWAVTDQTE